MTLCENAAGALYIVNKCALKEKEPCFTLAPFSDQDSFSDMYTYSYTVAINIRLHCYTTDLLFEHNYWSIVKEFWWRGWTSWCIWNLRAARWGAAVDWRHSAWRCFRCKRAVLNRMQEVRPNATATWSVWTDVEGRRSADSAGVYWRTSVDTTTQTISLLILLVTRVLFHRSGIVYRLHCMTLTAFTASETSWKRICWSSADQWKFAGQRSSPSHPTNRVECEQRQYYKQQTQT